MGFQITWKTKELPEIDNRFKPFYSNKESLVNTKEISKYELLVYCMNLNKNSNVDIKKLKFQLDVYLQLLEQDWKLDLQERLKEEEIWFCGWDYSRDGDFSDYKDVIYENIILYCFCSNESDPLDEDSCFNNKLTRIKEELDSLEEYVYDKWNHDFVDTYRDCQIKYDEEPDLTEV